MLYLGEAKKLVGWDPYTAAVLVVAISVADVDNSIFVVSAVA